jgi:hypothetical protein
MLAEIACLRLVDFPLPPAIIAISGETRLSHSFWSRLISCPYPSQSASPGSIVATYDYCDESGVLLSQTVRYAPKTFRRRRPDGKGGWVWSTKGIREVPYRLPQLLAALAQGSPIAIVEGEKDADTLWRIGVPATTNACGAKNTRGWRELGAYFQGADIILVPDNDDAGYGFINDVGAALAGTAKRIRVLMLPGLAPKGDASDWLDAGGTVEQWHALEGAAPDWVPPAPSADVVDEGAKAAASAGEQALLDELARVSPTEYDRRRTSAADELGVRRSTLDSAREARRAELAAERAPPPLFGHWQVEPWPEAVDTDALVQALVRRVRSHIVLTAEQALAGALWVMMAWVHADAAVHSPMLLITSTDPNCGKSTLADVCRYLAPRGINTVETTSASLYRLIDMYEPTIFVDEADEILVNPTRQRE